MGCYICGIIFIVFIGKNRYDRTTTAAYMYRTNIFDMCPQNITEWQQASRRLNCSGDSKNPLNRYHYLPVHDLSTLMEFCYNQTRPRVVTGLCMTYVQGINILDSYNCMAFDNGCPDMFYLSDESYRFPACFKIDPFGRCYVAESSCTPKTSPSTNAISALTISPNGTLSFATPTNGWTNNRMNMSLTLFLLYGTLLLLSLIVYVIYILNRRQLQKKKDKSPKEVPVLKKTKAEIAKCGFEYILDKLPNDSNKYHLIAKELKIPAEILFWTKEKRGRFVKRMEDKSITIQWERNDRRLCWSRKDYSC
nr:uncharacterized protein LOC117684563 isoform X2 [Crassostrea gigas]